MDRSRLTCSFWRLIHFGTACHKSGQRAREAGLPRRGRSEDDREVREKKHVPLPVRLVPFEAMRDWE